MLKDFFLFCSKHPIPVIVVCVILIFLLYDSQRVKYEGEIRELKIERSMERY